MAEPLKPIGTAYVESQNVRRLEFKPMPSVTMDYMFNQQTEVVLQAFGRVMRDLIGDARLGGLDVTVGSVGGTVTLSPGELLSDIFYVRSISPVTFTHNTTAPATVYAQITTTRQTYVNDPADVGVSIPGVGSTLEGANRYVYTATFGYTATSALPGDVAGTGANGSFTRTSGSFSGSLVDHLVYGLDAYGRMYGPFLVTANTTTTLSFGGDATNATSIRLYQIVPLASTVTAATTVTSLLNKPSATLSALAHAQNTDAYTSQNQFLIGGSSGPRALTTQDLPVFNPPQPPIDTIPTSLPPEINLRVSWYSPSTIYLTAAGGTGQQPHAGGASVMELMWGIHCSGTYGAGTITVSNSHDAQSTFSSNSLTGYIVQDSVGQCYTITGNSAVNVGSGFTVNVSLGSGQASPTNGSMTIRSPATSYAIRIYPYLAAGGVSSTSVMSPAVGTDYNGALSTYYISDVSATSAQKWHVVLIAYNSKLTPTAQATSLDTYAGSINLTAAGTPLATVNVGTITPVSLVGLVEFTWANPVGFDANSMSYQAAFTLDGSNPVFPTDVTPLDVPNVGYLAVSSEPGTLVKMLAQVVDRSGVSLSSAPTAAQGRPLGQAFADNINLSGPFSFSSLVTASFVSNGHGLLWYTAAQRLTLRSVRIVGIELNITTFTGSGSPSIKPVVWLTSDPTTSVYGSVRTNTGLITDSVSDDRMGTAWSIGLELVGGVGTVTNLTGTITVHYQDLAALSKLTPQFS